MTLWDNFSDELKGITLSERLNPANIFKFYNNQTNPPKIKFIALIASQSIDGNDLFAYLFINTGINTNIYGKIPGSLILHKLILKSDYNFLDHDSYIDCNKIYEVSRIDLHSRLEQNIGTYSGCLNDNDFADVINNVKQSTFIKTEIKKTYNLL